MNVLDSQFLTLKDGTRLPLEVLHSNAGYYIGTWLDGPYSRESQIYYRSRDDAQQALDTGNWVVRDSGLRVVKLC